MTKSKMVSETRFKTALSSEMNAVAAEKLRRAAKSESDAVYKIVGSSKDGIPTEEAKARLLKVGLNEVDYDKAPSWFVQLIRSFANPFVLVLLAIVAISFGENRGQTLD